jgi:hypothetical protein
MTRSARPLSAGLVNQHPEHSECRDGRRDLTRSALVVTPAARDPFESLAAVDENGGHAG